jgi:L-serine dehydratase
MKYKSVFDIIGPVMIGPSSSHTAGAARIGRIARSLFGREPKKAVITFYGSFAKTYKGHGTDVAIVGGILDFETSDERIIEALDIAKKDGITISINEDEALTEHPNTARIQLSDEKGEMELVGISIGGGKVEIVELNGYKLRLTGVNPALLVVHQDTFGVIASVTNELTKQKVNIGYMEVYRQDKGKEALMIIEVDQNLSEKVVKEVSKLQHVIKVIEIHD